MSGAPHLLCAAIVATALSLTTAYADCAEETLATAPVSAPSTANGIDFSITDCWDCTDAAAEAVVIELLALSLLPLTVVIRRARCRSDEPIVLGLCQVHS